MRGRRDGFDSLSKCLEGGIYHRMAMGRCCRHGCTATDRHAYKVPSSANVEARKSLLRKAWEGIEDDVEAKMEATLKQDLFICHDHFVPGTFKFTGMEHCSPYYPCALETSILCQVRSTNLHPVRNGAEDLQVKVKEHDSKLRVLRLNDSRQRLCIVF